MDKLDADWRFNIAYNAVLQSAVAALAASGFRPDKGGGNHHYRALQSLGLTIGLGAKELAVIEAHRKKRNVTEYERSGVVSDGDVDSIRKLAKTVSAEVRTWLETNHPNLVTKRKK